MTIYSDEPVVPPALRSILLIDVKSEHQVAIQVRPTPNLKFIKGKLHQWHYDDRSHHGAWLLVESE